MTQLCLRAGVASLLAAASLLTPASSLAAQRRDDGPRIVAIGDIHGDLDSFAAILTETRLIDDGRKWIGGRTRLVVTGDFLDRGEHVRGVMDLLMRLEDEARAQGGQVETLFGNHEGMNLLHIFRDVSPGAFAAFADAESETRRRKAYEAYVALVQARAQDPDAPESSVYKLQSEEQWMAEHPPGMLEYAEALAPEGHYGRWLRRRKAVLKLNDTIFMHAGLQLSTAPRRLEDVNRRLADELLAWDDGRRLLTKAGRILPFFTLQETIEAVRVEIERIAAATKAGKPPGDHVTREYVERLQELARVGSWSLINEAGPLWFRGFAMWPSPEEIPQVQALLKRYGAARFVVGHTILASYRITPRFGRRVFLIDTGMLSTHYKGRASALEILPGRITALYLDGQEVLDPPPASMPEEPEPAAARIGH